MADMTITIAVTDPGGVAGASTTNPAPEPLTDGLDGVGAGAVPPDPSEGAREVTDELSADNIDAPAPDLSEGSELSAGSEQGAPPLAPDELDAAAGSSTANAEVPDD